MHTHTMDSSLRAKVSDVGNSGGETEREEILNAISFNEKTS